MKLHNKDLILSHKAYCFKCAFAMCLGLVPMFAVYLSFSVGGAVEVGGGQQ